jgi:hypothetical protein
MLRLLVVMGLAKFCHDWPQTTILQNPASQVSVITDVH